MYAWSTNDTGSTMVSVTIKILAPVLIDWSCNTARKHFICLFEVQEFYPGHGRPRRWTSWQASHRFAQKGGIREFLLGSEY